MGNPGYDPSQRRIFPRTNLQPLPNALAHRTRLQTMEEFDRFALAASQRSASGQTLAARTVADGLTCRTVGGRVRRLSLLSKGRATLWPAFRQVLATLIAAIVPQPTLDALSRRANAIRYRLREPPRRRKLQTMPRLSCLS